jgi:tol-pal system protein YbgF
MKNLLILLSCLVFAINICATKNIADIIDESDHEPVKAEDSAASMIGRIEILEQKVIQLERIVNKIAMHNHTIQEPHEQKVQDSAPENAQEVSEAKAESETKEKRDYDQALAIFKDGNFASAANLFADFIETYPESKLSSNAYFWYGESFFRQKSFEKAALYYLKGYKKLPKGTKAADSLLKLSISLGEIKKEKEACGTLEKLKKEFPKRPQLSMKKAAELEKKFSCSTPEAKASKK